MRARTRLSLAVFVALSGLAQGCASRAPGGAAEATPNESAVASDSAPAPDSAVVEGGEPAAICVTGTVIAEGVDIAPRTWVRSSSGELVELLGAFAGNVRLLSGTEVQACGPGLTPSGALEVTEVELLEVDRMPAVLGVLRRVGPGWAVESFPGGDRVALEDVPDRLTEEVGTVVWVAGVRGGDGLAVRSYGVLEGWR